MAVCPRCHGITDISPCKHCGAVFVDGNISTPGSSQNQPIKPSYHVESVIASGGMGVVMRGKRQRDGQIVAMKAPRYNHSQARLRFTREARALATLQHPRILRLIDIDATPKGVPLLITNYVSGETLQHRLQQEPPLKPKEFDIIARGTGEALAHCHQRGVIHRDIKPDNIILGKDGIYLIDFGLALLENDQNERIRLTPNGLALGTPPFAAPEQLQNSLTSSTKSDCYSYGMVLHNCWLKVDWSNNTSLKENWKNNIDILTHSKPEYRLSINEIFNKWPSQSIEFKNNKKNQLHKIILLTIFCLSFLVLGSYFSLSHHIDSVENISGWLGKDGKGTISLAIEDGQLVEIKPQGDTSIRLLGNGPWSKNPIRLRGNQTGIIQLRVAALDGNWEIQIQH